MAVEIRAAHDAHCPVTAHDALHLGSAFISGPPTRAAELEWLLSRGIRSSLTLHVLSGRCLGQNRLPAVLLIELPFRFRT